MQQTHNVHSVSEGWFYVQMCVQMSRGIVGVLLSSDALLQHYRSLCSALGLLHVN